MRIVIYKDPLPLSSTPNYRVQVEDSKGSTKMRSGITRRVKTAFGYAMRYKNCYPDADIVMQLPLSAFQDEFIQEVTLE